MRTIFGVVVLLVAIGSVAAVVTAKMGNRAPEEPPWKRALADGNYIPLSDGGAPVPFPTSPPTESAIMMLVPPPPADLPLPSAPNSAN